MALSASDPLRAAAESFVARLRRGERPTLAEYTNRYPDQATRIRELFPKLLASERRANEDQATGPFGPVDDNGQHVPRSIGDYHIVREIGRGGMGIVYEAVQGSLGRQVALKILPSGPLSRGPFLERFRREARSAARLHHTNIVPVFGVGEHEGIHFYAMQYIEGLGLDSVLKEIRRRRGIAPASADYLAKTVNLNLTRSDIQNVNVDDFELGPDSLLSGSSAVEPSEQAPIGRGKELVELAESSGPKFFRSVARLGVQAAEALAYAHSQGVLHRDIKPSNLLLDRHGILWITDFGLAKAEGDDMTGTGDIVGTLRYMAPERFQAKSDARSDVYALGMTLYELIALRPAFEDGDRLRLVERINRERPTSLRSMDQSVPHDLETIVLKAIQKESHSRYSSAAEMADDIRRFLSDRPIKARRATLWEEFARWCRRNPTVASLVGIMLCLLAITVWANFQARAERDDAIKQKQFAEQMKKFADDRAWSSQVATAQFRRTARKVGQRFEAIKAIADAKRIRNEPLLTVHAAASLVLPDLRQERVWEGWPTGSVAVDFDDAFERYARSDRQGKVSIRRINNDSEVVALGGEGGPTFPHFSPKGGYLSIWHENDGRLTVWRLVNDSPVNVIDEPINSIKSVSFSNSDHLVAYGRIDEQLFIHDLPSGNLRRQIAVAGVPQSLAIRPSSDEIAVAIGRWITYYDVDTGDEVDSREFPTNVMSVVWNPDNRHLSVACIDGSIFLVSRGNGPTLALEGHRGGSVNMTYNHAGNVLVSTGADRTLRMWDAQSGRPLFAAPSTIVNPRFSSDDQHLAAEVDETRLSYWAVAVGREYRTIGRQLLPGKPTFRDAAISPDGRWLAGATVEGVSIWDLQSGEELAMLPVGDTVGCLFTPSGSLMTSGAKGVFEWPFHGEGGSWQIGPPQQLATWPCERLACNRDGSVIAAATKLQGAVVLDLDRPTIRNTLMSHENAAFIAVSPDGTRIATGTHGGTAVRIWDAQTNRLVRELPVDGSSCAHYSPDGRWLATNAEGAGIQLWAADVWKKGPLLPAANMSRVAFSPDGMFAAVESGQGAIRIYRTDREVMIVELEDPNQNRADSMQFSPDGSQLVVSSNDSHAIHIWNLAELRSGLAVEGLDWDAPTIARASPETSAVRLTPFGMELLDPVLQARWTVVRTTIAALSQPDNSDIFCRRGAALLDLGFNNLALSDFGRALDIRPDHGEASFLRGTELFRTRYWERALTDFEHAMNRQALADSARWMRGKALLQLDRVEEMMSEVNGLIKYYPNDPQLYYQRALGNAYRQNHDAALRDLETALRLGPSHDPALNNMAWILVTGPEKIRDPARAMTLVKRARNIAPHKTTYLNTYGATQYRLKQYGEALKTLELSLEAGKGQFDGYDLYFVAMCHAALNDPVKAQQAYDRAGEWRKRTRVTPHEESELEIFRKEAEAALKRE